MSEKRNRWCRTDGGAKVVGAGFGGAGKAHIELL